MRWAAQEKKQPQPCQLSLRGEKKQGSFSLLSSLSPGLQLLVGLERLQYLGGGGLGKERDKFGISLLLLNWGEGAKQFAKEIFNATGRRFAH